MRIFQFLLLVFVIGVVAFKLASIGGAAMERVNVAIAEVAR